MDPDSDQERTALVALMIVTLAARNREAGDEESDI